MNNKNLQKDQLCKKNKFDFTELNMPYNLETLL